MKAYGGIYRATFFLTSALVGGVALYFHENSWYSFLLWDTILAYFSYFEKNKSRLMQSHSCRCVCVSLPSRFQWCVYHGTWAHLSGLLHKSLPSVCVSVYECLLSFLGNGSVFTFPRQRIHGTKEVVGRVVMQPVSRERRVCVSRYCYKTVARQTFPRQWRIVRGFVFYAVHVVSKENMLLVLPRTSCFLKIFINETQTEKKFSSSYVSRFMLYILYKSIRTFTLVRLVCLQDVSEGGHAVA
jgi:hypothetical protein